MDVTSTQWTGGYNRGYDVYDPQRRAQVVNFRIQSTTGGCAFFVAATPVSSPGGSSGQLRGPGAQLRYDVFKDAAASQPVRAATVATPTEVISSAMPNGRSNTGLQFAFVIWAEQVVPPGEYTDDLELTAYEGQLGNAVVRDRRRLSVRARVPAVAEISFSEGAAFDPNYNTYSVNFLALRAGDRKLVRLKARSNSGYRLNFVSQNGGALRIVDPTDDSTVPYVLTVNGSQVILPRNVGVQAILNSSVTPATGQEHLLEFQVGDIGDATAGDYRDVINLSVFSLR